MDLRPGDGHQPVLHHQASASLVEVLHPLDGGPTIAAALLLATPVVVDTPVLALLVLVVLKYEIDRVRFYFSEGIKVEKKK